MKQYKFSQLIELSGLTRSEATNMVQKGIIRPDVQGTSGTGAHRVFGFLDIFEGCVLRKLNQIPGGMPTAALAAALDRIRFETVLPDTAWGRFLNPETRSGRGLWLCLPPAWADYRVLDEDGRDWLMKTCDGAVIVVRLDSLLIALEEKTQDCSTETERGSAWMKRETKGRRKIAPVIAELPPPSID